MNRQTLIFLAAAVIVISTAAACNPLGNYPNPSNFQGYIEQSFTRTSFTQDEHGLKAEWVSGDYILVMSNAPGASEAPDENSSLCMAMEDGEVVNFIRMDDYEPRAPYIAFYPPELAYYQLPDEQTYSPDGPKDSPMMAKSPTMYLMFRPICGALEVKLSDSVEDALIKSIRLRTDQSLCGGFIVDDSLKATVLGENELTLDCKSGVELTDEPTSFWFSLPENSYTGAQLTINTTDGHKKVIKLDDAPIEVKRAAITTVELN